MTRVLSILCALTAAIAMGAAADVVEITQVNFTFDPDTVTVQTGDTVRWLYTSGDHTVTSGTGPFDPDMGMVFDEVLNAGNPAVEHVFNDPGQFPYFCLPHFFFGMTGLVIVEESATSTEAATWSSIKSLFDE